MRAFQYIGYTFLGIGLMSAFVAAGSMDGTGSLWAVGVLATTASALLLAAAAMFIAARKIEDLEQDLCIAEELIKTYQKDEDEEEIQWS